MRRRRSDATPLRSRLRHAALAAAILTTTASAAAQGTAQAEGAVFLLAPIGARAVGQGQAVVAGTPGSEGLWWNPASLAWTTRTDLSLAGSLTFVATGLATDLVVPAGRAGVLAGAVYVLDFGEQQATDEFGPTGRILPRSLVLAGSYSATFGKDVAAGLTYKFVQQRFDCDGSCGNAATGSVSTSAFDFGMQWFTGPERRLSLGLAVRNLGFDLQVNDSDQADPLPTRVYLGAQYRIGAFEHAVRDGTLSVSAELADRPQVGRMGDPLAYLGDHLRVGAEFAWQKWFFLRAGHVGGSGDEGANSIGLGVRRGGLVFDFARVLGGLSSDAGKPPTYITLSFGF